MRYTSATNLINKDTNPYSISKRLGHSNMNTIMRRYAYYLEEADQDISDMLDEDYV